MKQTQRIKNSKIIPTRAKRDPNQANKRGRGRPIGAENKVTQEARALVQGVVDFEAMIRKYYSHAMRGRPNALKVSIVKLLMEYGHGKPPQAVQISPTAARVDVFFHDVE